MAPILTNQKISVAKLLHFLSLHSFFSNTYMKYRLFAVLFLITSLMSSCSVLRGLRADGVNGPGIYSFEERLVDTIARGTEAFHFAESDKYAAWLDTLHFYTEGRIKEPITLVEAIEKTSVSQGVIIIRNDTIVFEKYWGSMSPERLGTVFSISKSVTSLLCGIAVDEGYIKSIDDPVTDYIPELRKKDPRWQRLTVRHLLDMRSGLDFDDSYYFHIKGFKRVLAISRLNYGHNVMKQVHHQKFRCEPGTEHFYESMTSQILGIVIERATGVPYAEYLSDKVWKPLQMESNAVITLDSRRHRVPQSFGGISMTTRDLAKIGRLYLNGGVWDGKRIVSEEWIRQSTAYDTSNEGYHFNWYNLSYVGEPKPEHPGFYALGIKMQVLYANPDLNLIMVRIGNGSNGSIFHPLLFETLANKWLIRGDKVSY